MSRIKDWILDTEEYSFVVEAYNEGGATLDDVFSVIKDLFARDIYLPEDEYVKKYKESL